MRLYILIENLELKTEIVDGLIPYERSYLERFKPSLGGELFLIRKNPSENFYHFLYESMKGKFEWVKVYGYGEDLRSSQAANVRLHSSCFFSEQLHSNECDCLQQLNKAHEIMKLESDKQNIPGLLIYLQQEGRGHGLYNKLLIYEKMGLIDPTLGIGLRSKSPQQLKMSTYQACDELGFEHDVRDYSGALAVLEYFKIGTAYLMDDNPLKKEALKSTGITVYPKVLTVTPPEQADEYLNQKHQYFKSLEGKL